MSRCFLAMTLRIVPELREDGTTIRLIGRMRAEHVEHVRAELIASRTPTALDLDELRLADVDAIRFLTGRSSREWSCGTARAVHSRVGGQRGRMSRTSVATVQRTTFNWRYVRVIAYASL